MAVLHLLHQTFLTDSIVLQLFSNMALVSLWLKIIDVFLFRFFLVFPSHFKSLAKYLKVLM